MKKIDFKKQLPKIVIVTLVLFFLIGMSWGLKSVLELEGTMEPNVAKESLSPLPETKEELVGYVLTAVRKAVEERPAMSFSDEYSIDDETICAGEVQNKVEYIRTGIEDKIGGIHEDFRTDFGEDFSGKFWLSDVLPEDIASAELKYDYWVCPVCGKETDDLPQTCEDCKTDAGFIRKYKDEYTITLHVSDAGYPTDPDSFFARCFRPLTQTEIRTLIRDNGNGWFTCDDGFSIRYGNIAICAVVNRLTDSIASVTFTKDCDFAADVSFIGRYAALGTQNVAFTVKEKAEFTFTWPGISFAQEELALEPGQTDVLRAESTFASLANEELTWESSDESIATVNREGYVTAKRTTGQCFVTAAYTFKGQKYTATCLINVKVPAEKLELSRRKLKLSVGDTFTLKATVQPKNATIRTVTWYSTDEDVAVVDPDGTITAKRGGTVDVYAVSDDGYFKATCHVEVEP